MLVVVLAALAWFAAGGRADGFGPPPPSMPEHTQGMAEVTVEATLEGPLADLLSVRVDRWGDEPAVGRVGDGLVEGWALTLTATAGRSVDLPTLDTGWTVDPSTEMGGLLFPGEPGVVLAAEDPTLEGLQVPVDRVVAGIPHLLGLQVTIPVVPARSTVRTLAIPFGESTLEVAVQIEPHADAQSATVPSPLPDVAGTILDVPAAGDADLAWVGAGHPLWVTHTADEGVTVVDARSWAPDGLTRLVGWCAGTPGLTLPQDHVAFLPDGSPTAPWGPNGLTTYEAAPTDDGRIRLTGRAFPGVAPAPQPLEWIGGADGYVAEPRDVVDPACGPTGPGDPDRATTVPLGDLPTADIALLPATRSPSRVQGHLRLSAEGQGCLSERPAGDGVGCAGEQVPVAITPHDGYTVPGSIMTVDGELVVAAMHDGVVTELWPVEGTQVDINPPDSAANVRLVRVERITEPAGGCDPGPDAATCPTVVALQPLRLLAPDGPVPLTGWDGELPDGWVVLGPGEGISYDQPLMFDDPAAVQGIAPGDIVIVHDRWWDLDSRFTAFPG